MRRIVTVCALALVAASLTLYQFAPSSAATTIDVPADYPTIQAAIDASANGDTVVVAAGTYFENINFGGKAIVLQSASGPASTVIDGSYQAPVVWFNSGEDTSSVLRGFTIRRGATPFSAGYSGGGIKIDNSSPYIVENVVAENESCASGSGIYAAFSSAVIERNTIVGNKQVGCSGGSGGGGIGLFGGGQARIIGNVISNNTHSNGAGIGMASAGAPYVHNNLIIGNNASYEGGGMQITGQTDADIVQNVVVSNSAPLGSSAYISVFGPRGVFLANNTLASVLGSTLHLVQGSAEVPFANNVVYADSGYAVECNPIFSPTGPAFLHNNPFSASGPSVDGCSWSASSGNLLTDPLFTNSSVGDYHLQAGSPAVDSGDNTKASQLVTDFDGNPRFGGVGPVVDMGAFENPPFDPYPTFTPAPATSTRTPTPTGTPTMTRTPTSTPTPIPHGDVDFLLDCDVTLVGVQSACSVNVSAPNVAVDVVLSVRAGRTVSLGAIGAIVNNPDETRLLALQPTCPSSLDCNPDFNDTGIAGDWACEPPPPSVDFKPDDAGQQSFFGCFSASQNGPVLSGPIILSIARVSYDLPPGAAVGPVSMSLREVSAYTNEFTEIGSCRPALEMSSVCTDAVITLVDASLPTATPSASTTPTTSATPTAAAGPGVEKIPDGNANNTDLDVPAANLWICETGTCAGPGEGELRVVEHASNVHSDTDADNIPDGSDPCVCTGGGPDNTIGTADDTNAVAPPFTDLGLGAYEFSVEYDNFVIQSVNPCDIVFGTGSPPGAGANRGPVDELNSSAINPDCFGDPGPAAPGSCAFSLILENIVHFGCVSGGQNLGPTGDMDLASLLLIPHPDLNNDLFPGNNNGVLTVLKDNGCELVDTLGHPVHGSVNGGLTPYCRDLAVTVRILEGDLDLDCDVDLTDAQAIASRYGAFFGGLLYSKWYDLEPQFHDLDIDIKDVQKVFGRQDSTCDTPIPAQPPLGPPASFHD